MNNLFFLKIFSLAHQSVFLDWLILFFANPFIYILIFLALFFLIFYTKKQDKLKRLLFVFSSALFAWIFTTILKYIISSPRPFIVFENLKPLFLHGGMDSFPSGHSTFTMALAVSIFFINKKVGVYFIVGALLVGFARIAGGVHFPIDIFIGYIIGTVTTIIFSFIFKAKFINHMLAIFTKTL